MSQLTNATREIRTEARVAEIVKFLLEKKEMPYVPLVKHFAKKWGVSDSTVTSVVQYAKRNRIIESLHVVKVRTE